MPAPVVRSLSPRSCTRASQPRWASEVAAARPAKPPPTISARRGPLAGSDIVKHTALDEADKEIEHDADRGEQHDGVEHHGGVGLALPIGDEETEARIAANQLSDR